MKQLVPYLRTWRWPALAGGAAVIMLAAAHAFERFAMLAPCELCLRQREVYWAVLAMTLTAILLWNIRQNPRFIRAFNILLGLVFVTGAVVAAYHTGVEWKIFPPPSGCAAGPIDVMSLDLSNLDRPQATASCTEVPWQMLGLSMAGWNTLISAILGGISFFASTQAIPVDKPLQAAE